MHLFACVCARIRRMLYLFICIYIGSGLAAGRIALLQLRVRYFKCTTSRWYQGCCMRIMEKNMYIDICEWFIADWHAETHLANHYFSCAFLQCECTITALQVKNSELLSVSEVLIPGDAILVDGEWAAWWCVLLRSVPIKHALRK